MKETAIKINVAAYKFNGTIIQNLRNFFLNK